MNLAKIINKLYPGKEFVIRDDDINQITFFDGTPIPTIEQVNLTHAQILQEEVEEANKLYLSPNEFFNRFTKAERKKWAVEAKKDADIEDFKFIIFLSNKISTDDPTLVQEMNKLVLLNVITEIRKNQILSK